MDDKETAAAVKKMEELSTRMCSCKDKACADRVQDDFTKWSTEMGKTQTSKPSEELMKKASDIMTRYATCMTKAMSPPAKP